MDKLIRLLSITRLSSRLGSSHVRHFSLSHKLCSFFEKDDRGGDEYPVFIDKSWTEILKEYNKALKGEFKLLRKEIREHFIQDRKVYTHGDTDVIFRFDSEECLKQWRISSDKINKEGNSDCTLIINDKKKAVFSGVVDLTPPRDGKKRFSGYCGIKSVKKKKSFFRDDVYDLELFTHIELRVKGDGRTYAINLGILRYFDVSWFTTYTFSIFTHGGPYWQVIRIPFSKFFLTSKGRIQDTQEPIPRNMVNSIGITCAGVAGPFRLEIDYIGGHVDWREREKFAYEMYNIPKEYVSS